MGVGLNSFQSAPFISKGKFYSFLFLGDDPKM